jgi:hypothetical protein
MGAARGRYSSQSYADLPSGKKLSMERWLRGLEDPDNIKLLTWAKIHDRSRGYNGHQYALGLACRQIAAKNDQDPFVVSRKGL